MVGVFDETIGSVAAGLVEAPGAGLLTASEPVAGFWRSAALRVPCNVVTLTKVVGRGEPFHKTTEFVSKPLPVSVTVAAWPVGSVDGVIAVMTGTGLFTAKLTVLETPPPGAGFCTVIAPVELPVSEDAGSVAVRLLDET